jgi:ABC-type polysaccharide/polyol phosphate transport system ATPase subunit
VQKRDKDLEIMSSDKNRQGAIRVENIDLSFPLYRRVVVDRLFELVGQVIPRLRPERKHVLRSISLSIEPGEIVGLIGTNGAGKTTLLKVICDLLRPSTGSVQVDGKVMALLAMGMGFRPVLTGRENVYYGGLLLGMRRHQIDEIVEDIKDFSGLKEAFEQPYFTYSSGMRSRLGFSLATSVDAQIIILDESLATGDKHFITKCYSRIQDIQRSGKTVIFVSHNLGEIARMTNRVILLDEGTVAYDGNTVEGLILFEEILARKNESESDQVYSDMRTHARLLNADQQDTNLVHIGDSYQVEITIDTEADTQDSFVFLKLCEQNSGEMITYFLPHRYESLASADAVSDYNLPLKTGTNKVVVDIPEWLGGEGSYYLDVYVGAPVAPRNLDISRGRVWRKLVVFDVTYKNAYLKGAGTHYEMKYKFDMAE